MVTTSRCLERSEGGHGSEGLAVQQQILFDLLAT